MLRVVVLQAQARCRRSPQRRLDVGGKFHLHNIMVVEPRVHL